MDNVLGAVESFHNVPIVIWYVIAAMFIFIDILVVGLILIARSKWSGMTDDVHSMQIELRTVIGELVNIKTAIAASNALSAEVHDLRIRSRKLENGILIIKAVMVAKGWMQRDEDLSEVND